MNLITHIQRKGAEALLQHPDAAGLEIRFIPRDEWHSEWGDSADAVDADWFVLDCEGPAEQVARLRQYPALGDPAYLNFMATIGDVEEFHYA